LIRIEFSIVRHPFHEQTGSNTTNMINGYLGLPLVKKLTKNGLALMRKKPKNLWNFSKAEFIDSLVVSII